MNILKENTKGICHFCFKEIVAKVIEEDKQVYLIKECPEHGEFKVLIEKESWIYKKLMNPIFLDRKSSFDVLAISTTHLCNINCNICYLPERNKHNFSLQDMQRIISDFNGKWIRLSGGEPTLREDLLQIIEFIVKNGKKASLLTNGLRLTDIRYVGRLKKAGLKWIHFSFNGFKDSVYEKIDGKKLLKTKLKALRNINRIKIPTALSIMLLKGINENEVRKIYHYCLKNDSFIKQLRIRSSVHVGKYTGEECVYLSEIVKIVSKIIGVSEEKLVSHSLNKGLYYSVHNDHMPCHLEVDLFPLLMDEVGIKNVSNPLAKKILAVFKLLPKVGIKNLFKMFLRKLANKKRLLEFRIFLRVWPDKYRIDLSEIQRCPSGYVTSDDNKILPFCYALILNGKNNIL